MGVLTMKIDWSKKRWLPVSITVGILALVITVSFKKAPGVKPDVDNRPLVETYLIQNKQIQPSVTGYGKVQPKETWDAVAEVSGRIVYRHPELEKGKSLLAGTEILRIDPLDYQLKLAQAKSDLTSAKAELDKLLLEKSKLENSLNIEQRRLGIMSKELKRKEDLNKTGAVSNSVLEQERQNVLAQEQKVLDIETSLNLVPNNQEVAKASIQVAESRVKEAQRKLEKTKVVLPFDARIASVNIERDQVVSEREVMVQAHRWNLMEIPTQISMSDMRALINHVDQSPLQAGQMPDISRLNLNADVILYVGDQQIHWQGQVTRVGESIDTQGNSIVLMVEVSQGKRFKPGVKPPLINQMYVEVVISGQANELLVVPSEAIRGEQVYIFDKEAKLEKRPVEVGLVMGAWTVIDSGLNPGEKVITNDLIPAVSGISLREYSVSESVE